MIKTILRLLLACLPIRVGLAQSINSTAQYPTHPVPLTAGQWHFQPNKVSFLTYKGQKTMRLAPDGGAVVLNDVVFTDGTIEYDIEPILPESTESIYFHRQDANEQEIVYLRTSSTANPLANDGIQYAPYVDGVNLWDLYPDYQAPARLNAGQWNHVKLIILGLRLQVFLNADPQPVLDIPHLEARPGRGSIALEGAAYIANVRLTPNGVADLSPLAAPDLSRHDASYLRNWAVTQPQPLPPGQEVSLRQLPAPELFIDSIQAERRGLLNLSRRFGASPQRRVVWLQTTITTTQALTTNLQLGFSDEVWVFINRQPILVDKNLYQYNMRKYPDGRISIQNATIPLPLQAGENDLLIGVANDFYGWGLMARLESTRQIRQTGQLKPIFSLAGELARLDVAPYVGTYYNTDLHLTLRFTQQAKKLLVQLAHGQPVEVQAVGHHTFRYPSQSAEFVFDLATRQVVLREGADQAVFRKE